MLMTVPRLLTVSWLLAVSLSLLLLLVLLLLVAVVHVQVLSRLIVDSPVVLTVPLSLQRVWRRWMFKCLSRWTFTHVTLLLRSGRAALDLARKALPRVQACPITVASRLCPAMYICRSIPYMVVHGEARSTCCVRLL